MYTFYDNLPFSRNTIINLNSDAYFLEQYMKKFLSDCTVSLNGYITISIAKDSSFVILLEFLSVT